MPLELEVAVAEQKRKPSASTVYEDLQPRAVEESEARVQICFLKTKSLRMKKHTIDIKGDSVVLRRHKENKISTSENELRYTLTSF